MSSNTNLGNTPVSQGYTQLFHTGETGGLTSTLQQVFDGDGTGSDLYLATNKVKIGTAGNFLIGSSTIQEFIQDIVGDMFDTNGSHTNVTATYDDAGDGAIDLNATGAISALTEGTGVTITGTANKTIAIGQSVGTSDSVSFGRVNLGSTDTSSFLTGDPKISATGYMMIQGIINETETGSSPAGIVFGNNSTYGNDEISLITNGQNRLFINSSGNITISQDLTISGDLQVNGTTTTINQTNLDVSDNIIGLNRGLTGASANDSGLIIERGTTGDNIFIGYDESLGTSGRVRFATTTALPNATGALSFSGDANVHAGRFYGDVTGNVTGSASLNLLISSNLSDLNNASTARTNLGVDPAGTDNSTNVTLAGSLDYITLSGQEITRNAIDLTTDVTGVLPSANLDADTAHLSGTQTFSGAKTFSSTITGNLSGNVTGDVTGNADTATALATARSITMSGEVSSGAVNFDGTAGVVIPNTTIGSGVIVDGNIDSDASIAITKLASNTISGVALGNNLNALTLGSGLNFDAGSSYTGATARQIGLNLSAIDHDSLGNFEENEHIDWTIDQGAVNIHAGNYTDTNTNQLTTFVIQDGDITNVTIDQGKYLKFQALNNGGLDIDWASSLGAGSSGDPYDLQFKIDLSNMSSLVDTLESGDNLLVYNADEGTALAPVSEIQSALNIPSASGTTDGVVTLNANGTLTGEANLTFDSNVLTITGETKSTKGFTSDGNAKAYTWRAVNNTSSTTPNYIKIARITGTQSSRFVIELAGRTQSYSDTKLPAMGYIVGQLNNDNNFDIVYYNHKHGGINGEVVDEVGQVDVDSTTTDIYLKVLSFAEVTASGHISEGSFTIDSTNAGTSEPTSYSVATEYIVWNSANDGPGSGLNADLLDNLGGGSYLRSDANDSFTGSTLAITDGVLTIDQDDANEGGEIRLLPGNNHTSTYTIDNFYGHLRFFSSTTAGEQFRLTNTGNLAQLTGTKHYFNGDGGNTYIDEVASGQLRLVAGGTEAMKFYSSGAIDMYGGSTTTRSINIGANRSGNGYSYIDLVGDATYSDFGARFIRENTGPNTGTAIEHRGTGVLSLNAKDAGSVRFYTSNTERVRIDSSGNMSIGNISASRPLQIGFTTTNGEAIKLDGNASYGASIYYSRGGGYNWNAGVGGASSSSSNIPASYWGIEDVSQGNAVRLAIAHTTGNVGIGVNTPSAKLEINSSDGTETLRLHKSDTNIVENEIIGEMLFTTADTTLNADRKVIGAIKCFAEENFSGANSNEGSLQFFTANATDLRNSGSPTPRMVIDEDGNIGIGQVSPGYKLDVNGNARFVADARCEGRYLSQNGSQSAPSYSFNSQGNAGMFRIGTGIGLSAGGSTIVQVNADGRVNYNSLTGVDHITIRSNGHTNSSGSASFYVKFCTIVVDNSPSNYNGLSLSGTLYRGDNASGNTIDWSVWFNSALDSAQITHSGYMMSKGAVFIDNILVQRTAGDGEIDNGSCTYELYYDLSQSWTNNIYNIATEVHYASEGKYNVTWNSDQSEVTTLPGTQVVDVQTATFDGTNQTKVPHGSASWPSYSFLGDWNTGIYRQASDTMSFSMGGTEKFRFESDGDFHTSADVIAYSTTPSDKKLKTNIKDIDYGLDTIMKLSPKEYDWKKDNRHDIGFIAQEVEEVIPEIVKNKEWFDDKIKTLDYEKLTAVLIKAVQEQQDQINELREKLNG